MARFTDRVALVTGAGSGIGQQVAKRLRDEGAIVHAADRDPTGAPDGTHPTSLDVTDPDAFAETVDAILKQRGRIDVLINNAGIGSTTDAIGCTVEEWDRVFAVNARGVFLGTHLVLPSMLDAGRGAIVNTASAAALVGVRDRASYSASKGAVIAFTRQVAVQYAGTGVRCNCVCPGTVDSPWVGRLLDQADDPTTARQALVNRQPMGRLGTPEEIATSVVYLASDDAAFVTGTALVIDGGLTAA